MYLGDLLCRVQCLCETVSVYVQGRDHGYQTPGPLPLNRTVCVYLLGTLLVLRSAYARCCSVSLGHHYFFCVYRCEHEELKTFRWTPHPSVLHPLSCPVCSSVNALAARTNKEAEDDRQVEPLVS